MKLREDSIVNKIIERNRPDDKILTIKEGIYWHFINLDEVTKLTLRTQKGNDRECELAIEFTKSSYISVLDVNLVLFVLGSFYSYNGMNPPNQVLEEITALQKS